MKTTRLQQPQIIRALVNRGLTHAQAEAAHAAMLDVLEGAVLSRQSVKLGQIGVIEPRTIPPRVYTMGCLKVKGGGYDKPREYYLGTRTRYTLRFFDTFARHNNLK